MISQHKNRPRLTQSPVAGNGRVAKNVVGAIAIVLSAVIVLSANSAQANSTERTSLGKWTASSQTAIAITGDLVVTPNSAVGSLGIKTKLKPFAEISASTAYSKDGKSLASLLGVGESTKVQLWPVSSEVVARKAPNGGFCGKAKTKYLVMAIAAAGDPRLYFAAFTAKPGPGAKPNAVCGTYNYSI